MDIVWLKRDVRLRDHEPFARAAEGGRPFLILYMYEPDQLFHQTVHGSHIAFANEGLSELDQHLKTLSGRREAGITTRRGEATEILSAIHAVCPVARLLSHEETGHNASYDRDRRVKLWCRQHGVAWIEVPQSTVVRGLSLRDPSWREICDIQVDSFLAVRPKENPFGTAEEAKTVLRRLVCLESQGLLSASELNLPKDIACDRAERQRGGESKAVELLSSFLNSRGEKYAGGGTISSPNSAWTQCSRLSPYYSWGHISVRTVVHAVKTKQASAKGRWAKSLEAYLTRMEWRRTRIQDFEMRCWMEHRSVFQAWEHLREGNTYMFGEHGLLGNITEQQRIAAFEQGKTGYPMVDACMRCLLHTGWLNFRMRCMLASFATFNLWLDWRVIADHLARCFLDYEPGIHYVQLQLHAGTFGGMCHCYSMTKQAREQDPDGVFIRKYVPELSEVSAAFIHEPWKMGTRPSSRTSGRRWSSRYPMPIVDERQTAEASRKVIEAAQQSAYNARQRVDSDDDEMLQLALNASLGGLANTSSRPHELAQHEDDELMQLALKASLGEPAKGSLSGEALQRALQDAEDADLRMALEASLIGA